MRYETGTSVWFVILTIVALAAICILAAYATVVWQVIP